MSVEIMSMVFKRYPVGGGEMILALALADHAHDDGTHVFPSIETLTVKTRQSRRTVQYQLRRMEEAGWLILVNSGNGGRNQSREYRISPEWVGGGEAIPMEIKGAEIAPHEKGANGDIKGAIDDVKGANDNTKGCSPLHPHITINESSITTKEPSSCETPEKSAGFDDFWNAYPNTSRRVAKSKCRDLWKSKKLNAVADDILSHVKAMAVTKQWLDGYEPAPLTYLNQKRWEDGIPLSPAAIGVTRHGNFAKQDYHAGIAADGSF